MTTMTFAPTAPAYRNDATFSFSAAALRAALNRDAIRDALAAQRASYAAFGAARAWARIVTAIRHIQIMAAIMLAVAALPAYKFTMGGVPVGPHTFLIFAAVAVVASPALFGFIPVASHAAATRLKNAATFVVIAGGFLLLFGLFAGALEWSIYFYTNINLLI